MHEQRIDKYNKYVVAEDFLLVSNYSTVMQLPIFLRAVISTTSKEYLTDKRQSINALAACFLLSGQRTIYTKAKRSIAGFKLREGALIGCQTTLRKKRLHTIIDKLLTFALPRIFSEEKKATPFKRSSQFSLTSSLKKYLYNNSAIVPKTANNATLSEQSTPALQSFCSYPTHRLSLNKKVNCYGEGDYKLKKRHVKDKKGLAQEERTLLTGFLRYLKKDKINYIEKKKGNAPRTQTSHLALGIKDLLLVPELQEFLQLFDTVRGLNIGVSFLNSNPKEFILPMTFLSVTGGVKNMKPSTPQNSYSGYTNHHSKAPRSGHCTGGDTGILYSERKTSTLSPYTIKEAKEIKDKVILPCYQRVVIAYSPFSRNGRVVNAGLQGSTCIERVIKNPAILFIDNVIKYSIVKNNIIRDSITAGAETEGLLLKDKESASIRNNKQKDCLESKSTDKTEREGVVLGPNSLLLNDSKRLSKRKKNFLKELESSSLEKQNKIDKHVLYIPCSVRDTPLSNRDRRELFLTCFQLPKQYN